MSKCHYGRAVYCISACYRPKARNYNSILKSELTTDIECILKMYASSGKTAVIVISSNVNALDTDFLEVDFGLTKITNQPTRGISILDEFFTSRPDIFRVANQD